MDLGRAGGKVLIGVTLTVAALDGALWGVIAAAGIGVWTMSRCGKLAESSSNAIHDDTRRAIETKASSLVDEETQEVLSKEAKDERRQLAKVLLSDLEAQHKLDNRGNDTLSTIMGIGAYAAPALAIGYHIGVHVISKKKQTLRQMANRR